MTTSRVILGVPGAAIACRGAVGNFGPNDEVVALITLFDVGLPRVLFDLVLVRQAGGALAKASISWTTAAEELMERCALWQLARADEWRRQ